MASLRLALRAAPRASIPRPAFTTAAASLPPRRPFMFQATPLSREAKEQLAAEEAEQASEDLAGGNEDPNMNGNYPDPNLTSALPVKRQFRDPYGDWWDKQERRNYGEPIHEDNDILGIFSPEEYTHFKPGWGLVLMGTFIATVGALCVTVAQFYPDKPSAPRTFPGGLELELGGPTAPRAAMDAEGDNAAIVEGGSRSSL